MMEFSGGGGGGHPLVNADPLLTPFKNKRTKERAVGISDESFQATDRETEVV